MPVLSLDRKTIATLPADALGVFWDDKLKGFALSARWEKRSGSIKRTWILQYRIGKQQRKPKIGDFDKINPDQARKIAMKHFGQILNGVDPAAEKEAARAEAARLTFSQAVAQYLEAKVKELRPNSFKAVQLYLVDPKYFAPLHKRHLHKIEQRDIALHLDRINNENGTATAGQARAHLSSLFTWCMKRGHCAENPVIATEAYAGGRGIRHYQATSSGRFGIPAAMMTSARS
jgi:hypothetical protein